MRDQAPLPRRTRKPSMPNPKAGQQAGGPQQQQGGAQQAGGDNGHQNEGAGAGAGDNVQDVPYEEVK